MHINFLIKNNNVNVLCILVQWFNYIFQKEIIGYYNKILYMLSKNLTICKVFYSTVMQAFINCYL